MTAGKKKFHLKLLTGAHAAVNMSAAPFRERKRIKDSLSAVNNQPI
jgi:hypothetical protein